MVSETEWDVDSMHDEVQSTDKDTMKIIKVRGPDEQSVLQDSTRYKVYVHVRISGKDKQS